MILPPSLAMRLASRKQQRQRLDSFEVKDVEKAAYEGEPARKQGDGLDGLENLKGGSQPLTTVII